jgi:hypothetical protein
LADVVAESLHALDPGLTVLERGFAAGDTLVDILAIDAAHRLVALAIELDGDAAAVVRAFEAAAWCRDNWALVGRLFAGADLDLTQPVRAVVIARHLSDRARRLLRAFGPVGPAAFECRVFEAGGERYVAYEETAAAAGRADGRRGPAEPDPEPAAGEVTPARRGHAAAEPREPGEAPAAERAQSMIARLEALRLRQAFQS